MVTSRSGGRRRNAGRICKKVVAHGVRHADDAIDARVQEPHPRDGAEKAHVTDDAAVRDDLHGQPAARGEAVLQRLVAEEVQDVVAAALELGAQAPHGIAIELLAQRQVEHAHAAAPRATRARSPAGQTTVTSTPAFLRPTNIAVVGRSGSSVMQSALMRFAMLRSRLARSSRAGRVATRRARSTSATSRRP